MERIGAVELLLRGLEREAARDLQNRVLVGSDRHWAHVPGPLMHGFEGAFAVTDPEFLGFAFRSSALAASSTISAQMQGAPS